MFETDCLLPLWCMSCWYMINKNWSIILIFIQDKGNKGVWHKCQLSVVGYLLKKKLWCSAIGQVQGQGNGNKSPPPPPQTDGQRLLKTLPSSKKRMRALMPRSLLVIMITISTKHCTPCPGAVSLWHCNPNLTYDMRQNQPQKTILKNGTDYFLSNETLRAIWNHC